MGRTLFLVFLLSLVFAHDHCCNKGKKHIDRGDEPEFIPDPSDKQPDDWEQGNPLFIQDLAQQKAPDGWDEEMDGLFSFTHVVDLFV